jgi:heme/copper-type cytochrome/quinol oxidase subunit 2
MPECTSKHSLRRQFPLLISNFPPARHPARSWREVFLVALILVVVVVVVVVVIIVVVLKMDISAE